MDELYRTSSKGFFVDLNSIRGVLSTLSDKFKGDEYGGVTSQIRVSFKDGSTQSLPDVEALGSLTNAGRKEILELRASYTATLASGETRNISFALVDVASREDSKEKPITYEVRSGDPTWSKAAQLDLDEFVSAIERFNFSSAAGATQIGILLLSMALMMWLMTFGIESTMADPPGSLEKLRRLTSEKDLSPGDAVYIYAKWQQERIAEKKIPFQIPFLFGLMMISTLALRKSFVARVFKPHIFYFGGMISIINQRRTFHSVIWVGMLLALIVGLAGNYLSGLIFG